MNIQDVSKKVQIPTLASYRVGVEGGLHIIVAFPPAMLKEAAAVATDEMVKLNRALGEEPYEGQDGDSTGYA